MHVKSSFFPTLKTVGTLLLSTLHVSPNNKRQLCAYDAREYMYFWFEIQQSRICSEWSQSSILAFFFFPCYKSSRLWQIKLFLGLEALNCWAMWRAALITKDQHVLRLCSEHTIDICNSEGDECRSVLLVFAEQGLIKAATYGLRSAPCGKCQVTQHLLPFLYCCCCCCCGEKKRAIHYFVTNYSFTPRNSNFSLERPRLDYSTINHMGTHASSLLNTPNRWPATTKHVPPPTLTRILSLGKRL